MARHSKLALLLTLGTGLAALCMSSTADAAATKDPELYFYPAKSWAAGTTPMLQDGATIQKCSVRNEFNNGFIVQLDGSHKWVESISIDFRQNAFDMGKTYDVTLNVPGIQGAHVQAKAIKPNLLYIGLEGQKDFYQAMRDAAVFDMMLDENNFRFYMVGFANTAKNFERCMAGGTMDAAPTAAPADKVESANAAPEAQAPTLNESIALEQAESQKMAEGPSITEISPENPKATVELMDVKESTHLGGKKMTEAQVAALQAEAQAQTDSAKTAKAAKTETAAPVEAVEAAADNGAVMPLPEETQNSDFAAQAVQAPIAHKRYTEMLAEEIEKDPNSVAISNDAPSAPPVSAKQIEAKAAAIEPAPAADAAPESITWSDAPTPELDGAAVTAEAAKPEAVQEPKVEKLKAEEPTQESKAEPQKKTAAKTPTEMALEQTAELADENKIPPSGKIQIHREVQKVELDLTDQGAPVEDTENAPFAERRPVIETDAEKAKRLADAPIKEPLAEPAMKMAETKMPEDTTPPGITRDMNGDLMRAPTTETMIEPSSASLSEPSPAPVELAEASPAPAMPLSTSNTASDPELSAKVSDLQTTVAELEKENKALNEELKSSLTESKEEGLNISSDNWNLERATMRYNEAERQIARLGEQIQKERAQCEVGKKDLESMLFDPQVTSQQQLAKLADLEQKLAEAQQKLESQRIVYEERLKVLEQTQQTQ